MESKADGAIIAISGVTFSGNLGGQAMLRTSLQEIRRLRPNSRFHLLSLFPSQDAALCKEDDVDIVSASPFALVCLYLPIAVLVWPFARLSFLRRVLRQIAYFRRLMDAGVLLDHSGIAFVDDRGLPLLAYNVACCLPAIVLGVPVIKLPQALGPFRRMLNRTVAGFVLRRCSRVFARGSMTAAYLRDLGIASVIQRPDVSFALQVNDEARNAAQARLHAAGFDRHVIGIAPSRVVQDYCEALGIDLVQSLRAVVLWAATHGMAVMIIVHSHGRSGSKNNDTELCRTLARACEGHTYLIEDLEDAVMARALIGCCRVFVGCRFHSVVGALSMGVPAIALGWSHKYAELLEDFGLRQFALDAAEISAENLIVRLEAIDQDCEMRRSHVRLSAHRIRAQAEEIYTTLTENGCI